MFYICCYKYVFGLAKDKTYNRIWDVTYWIEINELHEIKPNITL